VNCPGFSLSMFSKQETPASQKKKRAFRWSIEQISRLNPADIDEYPHQEYSSTFEREEDEIQVQKAIDEYFSQSSIVPSPWTPTYSTKHVKFSPLPPATACKFLLFVKPVIRKLTITSWKGERIFAVLVLYARLVFSLSGVTGKIYQLKQQFLK